MSYDGSADKKETIIKVSLRDAVNELKQSFGSPRRSVMRFHRNEFEPGFGYMTYLVDDTIYETIKRDLEGQS